MTAAGGVHAADGEGKREREEEQGRAELTLEPMMLTAGSGKAGHGSVEAGRQWPEEERSGRRRRFARPRDDSVDVEEADGEADLLDILPELGEAGDGRRRRRGPRRARSAAGKTKMLGSMRGALARFRGGRGSA